MPGYIFSKFDVVSGIIWPVIRGLDTTATVTVPEELLLPLPLPLLALPLEQAASASKAATPTVAPNARSLNGKELMIEPPQRCQRTYLLLHFSRTLPAFTFSPALPA